MDKIYIEDLEVYAFHGVNQEEKNMGQRFLISAQLYTDLSEAGKSDDLTKTINYAELCLQLEEEFKKTKYDLIEKAAEELGKYILLQYDSVKRVKIKLKKPWAPIGKPIKYAAVEIDRQWHTAYIAVGANMGDKEQNIRQAIEKINSSQFNKVTKTAGMYETKPVGYTDQADFLNTALEVKTLMKPKELMRLLLNVEKELKRERIIKWGPRTIDLDVIFYDNLVTDSEEVVIPHPRMHERAFVLNPLKDIAPYYVHPILNERIYKLADELKNS